MGDQRKAEAGDLIFLQWDTSRQTIRKVEQELSSNRFLVLDGANERHIVEYYGDEGPIDARRPLWITVSGRRELPSGTSNHAKKMAGMLVKQKYQ